MLKNLVFWADKSGKITLTISPIKPFIKNNAIADFGIKAKYIRSEILFLDLLRSNI